jgi:CDP-diglyceride synthetase
MDERPLWDRPDEHEKADPKDGVRLLGSDEAAEAIERGDVAKRRGDGTPRYGDRPASPPGDGPRPALRFPRISGDDGADVARPRVSAPPPLPSWGGPVRPHPRAGGGERSARSAAIPQGDPAPFPRPVGDAEDDPVTAPSPAVLAGAERSGDGTPSPEVAVDDAETAPTPVVRRITSTPTASGGSSAPLDPGVPVPVAPAVPTAGGGASGGTQGGAARMRPGADDDVVRRLPEAGPDEVVDRSARHASSAAGGPPDSGSTPDAAPTPSAGPPGPGAVGGGDRDDRADAAGGRGEDAPGSRPASAGDDAGASASRPDPEQVRERRSDAAGGAAATPSDVGSGARAGGATSATSSAASGPSGASPPDPEADTGASGGGPAAPGSDAAPPAPPSAGEGGGHEPDGGAEGTDPERAGGSPREASATGTDPSGADQSGAAVTTPAGDAPEKPAWEVLGRSGARWRDWDDGDVEESALARPAGRVAPGNAAGDEAPLDPSEEQARPAPFGFLRETPAFTPGEPPPATPLRPGADVPAADAPVPDVAAPDDPAPWAATPSGPGDDTDSDTEERGPGGAGTARVAELRTVPPPPPPPAGVRSDVDEAGDHPVDRPAAGEAPPRDVRLAVVSGAALAGLAAVLFSLGDTAAMVLVGVVIVVATAELFSALQRGGYQPATLVGLVATAGLAAGTYLQGETALPVVMGLAVITGLLWYLFGVTRIEPTMNVGVTVLAVAYVGLLGSFAALILRYPNGRGVLAGVIVAVVANDIGALAAGRSFGKRLLAPTISPNKTAEGLIGGAAASIVASVVLLGGIGPFGMHPWELGSAVLLGLVVAVVAPLGDLSESLLKRDLGIKDMSAVIPGHGGVLDRVDALLFCLPAVYYLTRLLEIA